MDISHQFLDGYPLDFAHVLPLSLRLTSIILILPLPISFKACDTAIALKRSVSERKVKKQARRRKIKELKVRMFKASCISRGKVNTNPKMEKQPLN